MKTINLTIDPRQKPERLDSFLSHQISDLSRTKAQALIVAGMIRQDGQVIDHSNHKVLPGSSLLITIPFREEVTLIPQDIPLDIMYEDDDVLVICKPAGLVVHPAFGNWDGTLANAVLHHLMKNLENVFPLCKRGQGDLAQSTELTAQSSLRPGIIHRLDKDTSGVMVIAKNDRAKAYLQKQFQSRTLKKIYIALLEGKLEPMRGMIEAPIGRSHQDRKKMAITPTGKPAKTAYEVLEYVVSNGQKVAKETRTLVKADLLTGRTHQIRVHFTSINHPIVGDATYGHPDEALGRQFLHAYSLRIRLLNGKERTFEAPLTEDLNAYLNSMK